MKLKALFNSILFTLVISLASTAHAQTFSVIYAFTGGTDSSKPSAGVTIRGNALYGTTYDTVYQLTHNGSDWLFTTLAKPSSSGLESRAVFGPDGHLYSTSYQYGKYNDGFVFRLTPPVGVCKTVACSWTVSDLHDFGYGTDGQMPGFGDLVWDPQGNLYGTTLNGGTSRMGTVYEMTPSGNGYTESVLYSFSGPDGSYPAGGLVFDNQGNLFGTTAYGGSTSVGTVYKLTDVPGLGWTEHVLYNFQNVDDGEYPFAGLILDSAGNLYGTTTNGGFGGSGGGTVFELSPSGDTWTFNVLHRFPGFPLSGPQATLAIDGAGNLYGTAPKGGEYDGGTVFKLTPTASGWLYTSLHDFQGGSDGAGPISNVTFDTNGNLYGTASVGGDLNDCFGSGCGVVWMIKP